MTGPKRKLENKLANMNFDLKNTHSLTRKGGKEKIRIDDQIQYFVVISSIYNRIDG
jgi:hypothetical protein